MTESLFVLLALCVSPDETSAGSPSAPSVERAAFPELRIHGEQAHRFATRASRAVRSEPSASGPMRKAVSDARASMSDATAPISPLSPCASRSALVSPLSPCGRGVGGEGERTPAHVARGTHLASDLTLILPLIEPQADKKPDPRDPGHTLPRFVLASWSISPASAGRLDFGGGGIDSTGQLPLADPATGEHLRQGEEFCWTVSRTAALVSTGSNLAAWTTTDPRLLAELEWLGAAGKEVSVIAFFAAETFVVAQWHQGYLTDREFIVGQAGLWGGYAGGSAGAWVGFKVGAMTGAAVGAWFGGAGAAPGAVIGGAIGSVAGGIGGSYAGRSAGVYGVEQWFAMEDAAQREALKEFVFVYYAAP